MFSSLKYYWKIQLAVALGAALATAVLTGAMTVGDSVRGSLHDLTLQRLGDIDDALVASRFFRQDLAADFAAQPEFSAHFDGAAPAILLTGAAVNPSAGRRGNGVTIVGARKDFLQMAGSHSTTEPDSLDVWLKKKREQIFDPVVINRPLAEQLQVKIGDQVLLQLQRQSDIHRESLFGERDTDEVVRALRLTVANILPETGLGRFGLYASQVAGPNAFVSLPVLQRALEKNDQCNALFISRRNNLPDNNAADPLKSILNACTNLSDLGLLLKQSDKALSLESLEFVLQPEIAATATQVIEKAGYTVNPVYTYLANKLKHVDRLTPYSTVAALDWKKADSGFQLMAGELPEGADEEGLVVGQWLAQDLQVQVGDYLHMIYFDVDTRESLREDSLQLPIRAIVKMTGLAADRSLTPEFPGIQDADNIFDWDPPFPVDLDLIRDKDEQYWDDYRATPKAFIGFEAGRKLWASRFGDRTSLRITRPGGVAASDLTTLRSALVAAINPGQTGLSFQPLKSEALQASGGATDFSQLFIGFSYFLIIAAALLVGLLFRLNIEQRSGEVGVLMATGYSSGKVRRRFLAEAVMVATFGCLLGLIGAWLYGQTMITALKTLWVGATGTEFLTFFATPSTFVSGFFISLFIATVAIFVTIWKMGKLSPIRLMRQDLGSGKSFSGRLSTIILIISGLGAIGLVALAMSRGMQASSGIFFGVATCLLMFGLALIARVLASPGLSQAPFDSSYGVAMRNLARRPGRSMLGVGLVACACFVIVSVGAYRKDFRKETLDRQSGSGGFALVGESDISVPRNLGIAAERRSLDIQTDSDTLWDASSLFALRLRSGEDASCLNLYQPRNPRVLGVPGDFVERGGFTFLNTIESAPDNPWQLLNKPVEDDIIPGIADANSAQWIMHVQLGDTLTLSNQDGQPVRIRLVGLLATSIFQSEILIAESNFVSSFPEVSGFAYFLIDTPARSVSAMTENLESNLADYGLDTVPAGDKLAEFHAVQNTYLSVFQALGGLGLLLGTIGLAIVLFRNAIERRGEFATLRAFGFRLKTLKMMLLSENALTICLGILLGGIAALIAVMPHLLSSGATVPWVSLLGLMAFVFIFGILAGGIAVSRAMKAALLPALKANT